MDIVRAELLPEGKSKIIKEFKREGPTCMVGDGLNDAPALATADIGISMGISGSALATETGDIILMSNDIRRIPQAIKLARKAKRKVVENVVLSITMKGAILALAFAGHPLIWAAVLADVGTCVLVILNSMLLLRDKHENGNKCHRASSSSSLLTAEKLEDDVVGDMEAGLLPKSSGKHCKSGCCGNKNQEKVMKPAKTSSDHGHSGCCEKKHKDNARIVRKSCCGQVGDLGCCGDKSQQPHQDEVKGSCHNKPGDSEEICLDTGGGDCKSICCGTGSIQQGSSTLASLDGDEQEEVKVPVKGCCSSPADPVVVASLKAKRDGHCGSSCCGSSKRATKEDTCSQVKTREACKTNCSSREEEP